jgi:hypothetical protein
MRVDVVSEDGAGLMKNMDSLNTVSKAGVEAGIKAAIASAPEGYPLEKLDALLRDIPALDVADRKAMAREIRAVWKRLGQSSIAVDR